MVNSTNILILFVFSSDRVRLVKGDGNVLYENGDRTLTPSSSTRCTCGFKHYWDGKEYDNFPEL